MDKKKILGVKPYHYIYWLVIVLLLSVLVYMFVKLKQVSTDVPLQANETTTEIVPQQAVESDYEHSQKYYIIVFYGLVASILFFVTTPISKDHAHIIFSIIFCFTFSIVSLMKDHLTISQKISLILYLCAVPLTIVAVVFYHRREKEREIREMSSYRNQKRSSAIQNNSSATQNNSSTTQNNSSENQKKMMVSSHV